MTDLAINWDDALAGADISLDGAALATESGLRTAVILSLFTDARARDDDPLPADDADRRGWWGDALPTVARDRIGSRLWLLARETRSAAVLGRARDYAQEALAWLVEDGIARSVSVIAEPLGQQGIALGVTIDRPAIDGRLRFDLAWNATASESSVNAL